MSTNEKKRRYRQDRRGASRQVKRYIEEKGMTMGDFVSMALQDELHPRLNIKEDKDMSNMRTLAFQVPEELFQKIKDYLQRNNMTQKQFVIGLIENEIERDLTQRVAMSETPTDTERMAEEHTERQETAAASDFESISEEVGEEPEEQESTDFSDDFDDESEESENPYEDEDLDESENQNESEDMGMAMGM